jgi:hypothetical protein
MIKTIDTTVANEIVRQIGGMGRISAMIAAHNFQATDNSVTFKFKGSRKANIIKITLNSMDLYDLEFIKYSPSKYTLTTVKEENGIYNDMLKDRIEQFTGLYLSL